MVLIVFVSVFSKCFTGVNTLSSTPGIESRPREHRNFFLNERNILTQYNRLWFLLKKMPFVVGESEKKAHGRVFYKNKGTWIVLLSPSELLHYSSLLN